MNHIEISIKTNSSLQDILIAELSVLGFDGFEETDDTLKAFINEVNFDREALGSLCKKYGVEYEFLLIEGRNWNELWESSFEPVKVDDFAGIRAGFHPPMTGVEHEIVITPKMSFGTGHHATTFMMMQLMRETDFAGKKVFDFGTGTGILAILADKLGAAVIQGVDNDENCIENATENIQQNNCYHVDIQHISDNKIAGPFDVILANINKNIILDNLSFLAKNIAKNGDILLSGLLEDDEMGILFDTGRLGWKHLKTIEKNGWIAIHLVNSGLANSC